jgi:hypothetical protein
VRDVNITRTGQTSISERLELELGIRIVASVQSALPPECLMVQFKIPVSATSVQIVRGSKFVMSVPPRIWEPSRDTNGKILWSSRSRTDLDERMLIDALDRAIRDSSGVAVNRRLLWALGEQPPVCSAAPPFKRDDNPTAGLLGLAAAVRRVRGGRRHRPGAPGASLSTRGGHRC